MGRRVRSCPPPHIHTWASVRAPPPAPPSGMRLRQHTVPSARQSALYAVPYVPCLCEVREVGAWALQRATRCRPGRQAQAAPLRRSPREPAAWWNYCDLGTYPTASSNLYLSIGVARLGLGQIAGLRFCVQATGLHIAGRPV